MIGRERRRSGAPDRYCAAEDEVSVGAAEDSIGTHLPLTISYPSGHSSELAGAFSSDDGAACSELADETGAASDDGAALEGSADDNAGASDDGAVDELIASLDGAAEEASLEGTVLDSSLEAGALEASDEGSALEAADEGCSLEAADDASDEGCSLEALDTSDEGCSLGLPSCCWA